MNAVRARTKLNTKRRTTKNRNRRFGVFSFVQVTLQLDFFLSYNNDVTRTLAQDSGSFAFPSNSWFPSLARSGCSRGASPLGSIPHSLAQGTTRLAGRKISLIIRQSPRNVPLLLLRKKSAVFPLLTAGWKIWVILLMKFPSRESILYYGEQNSW